MKFSKNMMIVCVLLGAQAADVYAKLGDSKVGSAGAQATASARTPSPAQRPVQTPTPAPVSTPVSQIQTPAPSAVKPSIAILMNYLEKPANERTREDYGRMIMAGGLLLGFVEQARMADEKKFKSEDQAKREAFREASSIAQASNLFNKSIQEMLDSNWNMITKRPIMKIKYENSLIEAGRALLAANGGNLKIIDDMLGNALKKRITDESSRNKYVVELVDKISLSSPMDQSQGNDSQEQDLQALFTGFAVQVKEFVNDINSNQSQVDEGLKNRLSLSLSKLIGTEYQDRAYNALRDYIKEGDLKGYDVKSARELRREISDSANRLSQL